MKELIELAKEKGFETNHGNYFMHDSMPDLKDEIDYFLMCELQKWLRDKSEFIYVSIFPSLGGWKFKIDSSRISEESVNRFRTYEIALKKGLEEALKILK